MSGYRRVWAAVTAVCMALCLVSCGGGGGVPAAEQEDGPSVTENGGTDALPGPAETEPGPADAEPGPADAEPNPAETETKPADAEPNPAETEPGNAGTDAEPDGADGSRTDSAGGSETGGASLQEDEDPQEGVLTEDPLPSDRALSDAVTAHNRDLYAAGTFAAESHVILAAEQEDTPEGYAVTVYLASLYQAYSFPDGEPELVSAVSTPAALTFLRTADGFRLTDYWEPEDGGDGRVALREKFPASIPDEDLDMQTHIVSLMEDCTAQAEAYARHIAG